MATRRTAPTAETASAQVTETEAQPWDEEEVYTDQAEAEAAVADESFGETDQAEAPSLTDEELVKAKQDAYSKATTALREAHREEFDGIRQRLLAERGITWSPPPTEAEKAKSQIETLLASLPEDERQAFLAGRVSVNG